MYSQAKYTDNQMQPEESQCIWRNYSVVNANVAPAPLMSLIITSLCFFFSFYSAKHVTQWASAVVVSFLHISNQQDQSFS